MKEMAYGIMLTVLLLVAFVFPMNPAYASTQVTSFNPALYNIQNISRTWIVNTPNYKEAIINIITTEQTFEFHFNITIIEDDFETIFNVSTSLPDIGPVYFISRFPDTLGGAPYTGRCTTVEAFRLDIPSWLVPILESILAALTCALLVAIIIVIVDMILEILCSEGLVSGPLWDFIGRFGTVLLSIPWIFLTVFQEKNPDGSVTLYFPYMYTEGSNFDYAIDLLFNYNEYAIASNMSWWRIVKHVYRVFWLEFIWFSAEWYGFVYPPEEWCKPTPPIIILPQPWIYKPMPLFVYGPQPPFVGDAVTFISASYSPNGTITYVHWSFGDGYDAEGFNVTHVYGKPGKYVVTMDVIDNWNSIATISYVIDVLLPATVDIEPACLILKTGGNWTAAYIELPEGYNVSDINVNSIMLNGTEPVVPTAPTLLGDHDRDGFPDLMVLFNRTAAVQLIISQGIMVGNVAITITGQLADGAGFMGSGVISVRMPGDLNMDGMVDMKDISLAARAFGSYPGHPRWNYVADENEDGIIDMRDIALTCRNFGKTYT
ncbi:MAG: PKD domain-containing protein [Candidatus Bathyarchaeia archaeon]